METFLTFYNIFFYFIFCISGCIRDSKTYCDPKKGSCQCCWQDTYCGCWWDLEFMGGCRCRTGTRVTCHEKKDCPNRSSWTTKPFKPEQCNVGTWGWRKRQSHWYQRVYLPTRNVIWSNDIKSVWKTSCVYSIYS